MKNSELNREVTKLSKGLYISHHDDWKKNLYCAFKSVIERQHFGEYT